MSPTRLVRLQVLALSWALAPWAVFAQPVLQPGDERTFTAMDDTEVECRIGQADLTTEVDLDCLLLRFLGTRANLDGKRVVAKARTVPGISNTGIPSYATASLLKDISLSGPPGSLVEVQFSVTYDFRNQFTLAGAYKVGNEVSFGVIDLSTGRTVTSQSLFTAGRDADQGFTDVAVAFERQVISETTNSFSAFLYRGRDYRLVFSVESQAQAPIVGQVLADGTADLKLITVRIDEDEVEQLALHDGAVRSALAAHDAAVRGELAAHDRDIKALLDELVDRQKEIIRLLLTPQGRRESDLGDFPLKSEATSSAAPGSKRGR